MWWERYRGTNGSVPPRSYSPQERAEALGVFVVEGTIARASRACGVPERTLRDWVRAPESRELLDRLRQEHGMGLADAALAGATKALERVTEKLDDPKASAKDCAIVFGILVDKAGVLREQYRASDLPNVTPESQERLARVILEAEQELRRRGEPVVADGDQRPPGDPRDPDPELH